MKRLRKLAFGSGLMLVSLLGMGPGVSNTDTALAGSTPIDMVVEQDPLTGDQFIYVVFHALDRDGFCKPPPGAVSLHPVLGIPVNFVIEAGDGIIIDSSAGAVAPGRVANNIPTFSTAVNATLGTPVRAFPPLVAGLADECQSWIRVSQSIPGPLRVLVTVESDDGKTLMFVADLERETGRKLDLNFRWTLITWSGAGATPTAALQGDTAKAISAIYGWDSATQTWRAYFPDASGGPGANDLTQLAEGQAYWVAVKGPGGTVWSVPQ